MMLETQREGIPKAKGGREIQRPRKTAMAKAGDVETMLTGGVGFP